MHRNKRGEVKSVDDWIQIARSSHGENKSRLHLPGALTQAIYLPEDGKDYDEASDEGCLKHIHDFPPAATPIGASLSKALAHYHRSENEWKQSKSWTELKSVLDTKVQQQKLRIEKCVCLGLSSPTGLVQATIDRRNVSMYQLVVFVSMIEALTEGQSGQGIEAFAQDPVFNRLDIELLASLNIKVVEHPAAFHLITPRTFSFCPGAEQHVLRGTLSRDPAIHMGFGELDTYLDPATGNLRSSMIGLEKLRASDPRTTSEPEKNNAGRHNKRPLEFIPDPVRGATILHNFKKDKERYKLLNYDVYEHALYDTHLFWRTADAASSQQGEVEEE